MSQQPIIIYSRFSPSCRRFIDVLGSPDGFTFVCIDHPKIRSRVLKDEKLNVKTVPTVLTPLPEGGVEKYDGVNAFRWLQNVKEFFMTQNQPMRRQQQPHPQHQQQPQQQSRPQPQPQPQQQPQAPPPEQPQPPPAKKKSKRVVFEEEAPPPQATSIEDLEEDDEEDEDELVLQERTIPPKKPTKGESLLAMAKQMEGERGLEEKKLPRVVV